MEEVIDLLVAPNIHVKNTEANDCMALGQGQTFSHGFPAFVDFVGSIIVVVGEHIAADMGLVVDRPVGR